MIGSRTERKRKEKNKQKPTETSKDLNFGFQILADAGIFSLWHLCILPLLFKIFFFVQIFLLIPLPCVTQSEIFQKFQTTRLGLIPVLTNICLDLVRKENRISDFHVLCISFGKIQLRFSKCFPFLCLRTVISSFMSENVTFQVSLWSPRSIQASIFRTNSDFKRFQNYSYDKIKDALRSI